MPSPYLKVKRKRAPRTLPLPYGREGRGGGEFSNDWKLFRGGFLETKRTKRETKDEENKCQTIMTISNNGNLHENQENRFADRNAWRAGGKETIWTTRDNFLQGAPPQPGGACCGGEGRMG